MISKKIVLLLLTVAIMGGVMMFGAGQVYAQTNGSPFSKFVNPFTKLVQMISQKFGLDQGQVQSVFDRFHQERKQEMQQNAQQREQDRLNKLVQDEKITEAQKQAILDKLAELRSKYNPDNFKDMTVEQRKQQFQAQQDEIKSWVESQGIDPSYVMPGFGMGGRKGMGKQGGWFRNNLSPKPTQ